jgi:hypothetical protein
MRFPSNAAVAALSLSLVFGCSSKQGDGTNTDGTTPPTGTPGTDNGGIDGTAQTPTGHDSNPDGKPYPAKNVGYSARGIDRLGKPNKQPGNVIPNYKFLGYPDADKSKGLQTVALADFYDPEGKNFKIIHLVVAGVWCKPCNQETDALVPAYPDMKTKGVVVVQALGDGPKLNVGATKTDLDSWIDNHHTNFTQVLDPGQKNLGVFFDAAAIPWNADVDARTMEILQAGVGYQDPADVQIWLDWYAANPAAL